MSHPSNDSQSESAAPSAPSGRATRPSLAEVESWVADAVDGNGLSRERADVLGHHLRDEATRSRIAEGARAIKRATTGDRVTVSRNIFIPLTNLCRNRCT